MKQLLIIGAGGYGGVVYDIAKLNGYENIAFLDDSPKDKVVGKISEFEKFKDDAEFVIAIGDNTLRERFYNMLTENGAKVISLAHPSAIVAESAFVDNGTVIMAGAIINPNAKVGRAVIVNTCCSIDHDSVVEDFTHISVGARICGTVHVGSRTFVGAGATIINNISVCANCMIGAGAVVVKNISAPDTYVGTPAGRKLKTVISDMNSKPIHHK